MHLGSRLLPVLMMCGHATLAAAQDSACVTVRDAVSRLPIASALLRPHDRVASQVEVWSDTSGHACWPRGAMTDASVFQLDALGYGSARRQLRQGTVQDVSLDRALGPGSTPTVVDDAAWRRAQVAVATSLAIREVRRCVVLRIENCAYSYHAGPSNPPSLSRADSTASAHARIQLQRTSAALLEKLTSKVRSGEGQPPQAQASADGIILMTYVDDTDSTGRYTEVRVTLPSRPGRALFGATEMTCRGTDCDRARQVSLKWIVDEERQLAPELAISADGRGDMDAFDLRPPSRSFGAVASGKASPISDQTLVGGARDTRRSLIVRGVVRDEQDHAVKGAQILSSPGDGETRADSTGTFVLVVRTSGSTILTARAIGHAPVFRVVAATRDTTVDWEPRLRPVHLLAARIVTGTGTPAQLSSWRYDELMARRAQGKGFFMVGNEISSSSSIGDALSRAPGLQVKMKYSNTIQSLSMSRCTRRQIAEKFIAPDARIGVWVNGIERTLSQQAEDVLSDLLVAEVIALEVYNGASAIPAEYTGANYCGVVSAWTR